MSELFIQGDDRYFYRFSQLQSNILNNVEESDEELYMVLSNRVERQYVAEFDNTRRNYYLKELEFASVNETLINRLKTLVDLEEVQFTSFARYKEDDIQYSNDVSEFMEEFDLQIQLGNENTAKELLVRELNKVHEKGISISNYSSITNLSLELMNQYADSSEEVIELLNHIIKNPFDQVEWILIETIIDVIGDKLNEEESTEILKVIMEHFCLILRTPNDATKKYEWLLELNEKSEDNDGVIFEFILWLSNLPDMVNVKERTFDVALWLTTYNCDKYIGILLDKIMTGSDYTVRNLSCAILHNIAQTEQIVSLCKKVSAQENFICYLNNTNDFLVLSTFYEILRKGNTIGVNKIIDLQDSIKQKLFTNNQSEPNRVKNNIDTIDFGSNGYTIESLNKLVHFTIDDIKTISEGVKSNIPLSIKNMKKVENIIERSYHLNKGTSNYCDRILMDCVNNVITKYIDFSNYHHVVEILRRYNPNSPEPNIGNKRPNIFDKVVSVFEGESMNIDDCIIFNDHYVLHFHEAVENEENNRFDRAEIVAFLCEDFDIENVEEYRKYNSFFINTDPCVIEFDEYNETMLSVPLINKAKLAHVYGSMYTSSEIDKSIDKDAKLLDNINKRSWRDGKCLDVIRFGMPKKEGTFLLVKKESLDEFRNGKSLIFKMNYNLQTYYLDYDKKIIY